MSFARRVFIGAGIWGIAALLPLYFLVDLGGRRYPAPTEVPHFFYGFVSVATAWQIAFLVIGTDPVRFRPLMLPSILEKLGYVVGTTALYLQGHISPTDAGSAVPDGLLLLLFVMAFLKTPSHAHSGTSDGHRSSHR